MVQRKRSQGEKHRQLVMKMNHRGEGFSAQI